MTSNSDQNFKKDISNINLFTMQKYSYKKHKLHNIKDFEILEAAIKEHGDFSPSDYQRAFEQAKSSKMPTRLIKRVVERLKPMVLEFQIQKCKGLDIPLRAGVNVQIKSSKKTEVYFKDDTFSKTYRASDFNVENGYIEIKGMRLYNKDIKRTFKSSLVSIDKNFRIEKDNKLNNRFRFLPAMDLYVLLAEIKERQNISYLDSQNRELLNYNDNWSNNYYTYDNDIELSLKFRALKERLSLKLDAYAERFYCKECKEVVGNFTLETNGEYILKQLLIEYGIEGKNWGGNYFDGYSLQCNVAIDVPEIEIFDGYIEINIVNPQFAHIPWDLFCYMSKSAIENEYTYYSKDFYRVINKYKSQFQSFIREQLSSFFDSYNTCDRIRINTYISAKSFEELLQIYKRETKSKPVSFHVSTYDYVDEYTTNGYWGEGYLSPNCLGFDQIAIPFSFLTNEENEGDALLLHLMASARKDTAFKDIFTSDLTPYFDDANVAIKKLLADFHCKSKREEDIKEILISTHRISFIREVSTFYKDRDVKASYLKNQTSTKVFRFYENCDYCTYHSPTKGVGHMSYLLIDKDKCIIRIYPMESYDPGLSFSVVSIEQLDTAALAIMKFFNSNIMNKRMDFKIPDIFKHLGIKSFREIHTTILR